MASANRERRRATERRAGSDDVNHPPHYTSHPSGVECIDIVEHFTFCVGNTIKYCWRAGLKGAPQELAAKNLEDLRKARWYLDREIARLEKGQRDAV